MGIALQHLASIIYSNSVIYLHICLVSNKADKMESGTHVPGTEKKNDISYEKKGPDSPWILSFRHV